MPDTAKKNIELIYRLRSLGMGGAILHVGAHPDDEDVGLVAYMARKIGVRVVYWSATRGEGGQNRIGPYQGMALGLYRSWESLAAREVDGGQVLFGPFIDFGFSKNGAEALDKWGRQDVVREIVRAIRLVQPQIVIGRWTGGPGDGHGHHQAVGEVTEEAFEAAGDAEKFPELGTQGLVAWQPQKLYYSTSGDWNPGEDITLGQIDPELERLGALRINSGEFDPIAGRTYQEQAWIGFDRHQTQAMDFAPDPGDWYYYYRLHSSQVPVPDRETSFYDGLDATLTGLADYPGRGSASLRAALERIKAQARAALKEVRADDPLEASTLLLEGGTLLHELWASLPQQNLEGEAEQALDTYLARKIVDFETTAAQCLGMTLECLTDNARITPGQRLRLVARLWNHRGLPTDQVEFVPQLPSDWTVEPIQPQIPDSVHSQAIFDVTAAKTAELACPYWLRKPPGLYKYTWPKGEPSGRAFGPPLVEMACEVTLGRHKLTLRQPAMLREGFAGGFRELPMTVLPPISLHPKTRQELLVAGAEAQQLTLYVVACSNMGLEGTLTLRIPSGWDVEPQRVDLALSKIGDAQTLRFVVTIPGGTPVGQYPLRYVVRSEGRDYDVVLDPVRMGAPGLPRLPDGTTCIKEAFITRPAEVALQILDVKFMPDLKYGYIEGAADEIMPTMDHFGLDFAVISDEEMGFVDLSQFDAVVVGPNAYLVRDELCKNAGRFLKYVEQGGTLIVQFQGYGYQGRGFTPYPFSYSQPHDRVTYHDAPVTILAPDHFLVNQPNKIGEADWEGWVMDRGMYFFGERDERYAPILACNDPGEEPKTGGMLVANYGRGTYVYVAYSFFRQLPAGVPGAFRLFANLLALPAARTLARAAMLKDVSLFSFMDEDQLQALARIMSERWVPDGTYLCHQGDEGDEMYVIAKGQLDIIKESRDDLVLYVAQQGQVIGEMAVLADIPRAAAVRANGDVHLLVIEGEHFRSLLHEYPTIADRVIELLVRKLAERGG